MIFKLSLRSSVIVSAVMYCIACANSSTTSTPTTEYLLVYAHSADYGTYKLDWIEKLDTTYTVKKNQVSVASSSGLKSPTFYGDYLMILDSSSVGKLLVYDKAKLTQVASLSLGGAYPNEMVIEGMIAYITINGDFGTQGNAVKVVSLANPTAPSIVSTLTVGNKPAALRKFNGKLYLANQDSITKSQATVQSIDLSTNTVSSAMNVGENPSDLAYDGLRVWSYNSKWFGGTTASVTYITGTTPVTITGFPGTYKPAFGGNLAFNNAGGFITLSTNATTFNLFSVTGTTVNTTPIDSTNDYKYVGTGGTYLYKIHNGTGSTTNLTVTVESVAGAVLTTQSLTKDSDMSFFPNK